MNDIPLNADVECSDGACGKVTYVIVNPTTQKITHFVINTKVVSPSERLVPIDWIKKAKPDVIRLNCAKGKLSQTKPFKADELFKLDRPDYLTPSFMWPFILPETMVTTISREQIPFGELAVSRGAQVEALDGHVGQVDEFLLNAEGEHITHLVMREGHLWGKKDILIPISAIDHLDQDKVFLKLNKREIESLPDIPVKRDYSWTTKIDNKVEG
jgi:sporulation protein YlmC with PRC-barrel domain